MQSHRKVRGKSLRNEIYFNCYKHSISIANVEALPDIDAALQLSHSATDKAGEYRVLSEGRTKTRVMKDEEIIKFFEQYEVDRSPEVREKLICAYMPKATIIAKKLKKSLFYEDFDDLQSDGYIGIIKAIDNFDSSKGNKLDSYIETRIYGSIIDGVRQRKHYRKSLKNVNMLRFVSIEDNQNETERMIAKENVEDIVNVIFNAELIKNGIKVLSEKNRKIIWLYFFTGLTQSEIGALFSISTSNVSQRITRSLKKMKKELNHK